MNHIAIIVFAKNPKLGFCKTRLAAKIGDQKAMEFFIESMSVVSDTLSEVQADIYVFFAGDLPDVDSITANIWKNAEWRKQVEGDLGVKIFSAFKSIFALGYEKILLMGSDCPEVDYKDIFRAFDKLDLCKVVFGPACDGGYYLIRFGREFDISYESISRY